jgi:hypothetical protein
VHIYKEAMKHLEECEFNLRPCTLGCGLGLLAKDMAYHTKVECAARVSAGDADLEATQKMLQAAEEKHAQLLKENQELRDQLSAKNKVLAKLEEEKREERIVPEAENLNNEDFRPLLARLNQMMEQVSQPVTISPEWQALIDAQGEEVDNEPQEDFGVRWSDISDDDEPVTAR